MTTLANREGGPTAYELLVVHPSAPADLIATSYWLLTGDLLKRRDAGKYVDDKLHELTRAYECVSDPVRRAAYDAALGHTQEPLAKRGLPHVRRSLISADVDHYEVLGITSAAPSELLPSAHRIMRNQYLRVPLENKRKLQLLDALDDAFATLGAPEKRQQYDERSRLDPVEQVVAPPPETPASARSRGTILRGLGRALSPGPRLPKRTGENGHSPEASETASRTPAEHPAKPAKRAERPAKAKVPAERRVKPPAPPEPPIIREPAPRSRTYAIDVEEVLLGRIAAYVKETPPPHLAAEPAEGPEGPRSPRS
jgi:hypothetical protein